MVHPVVAVSPMRRSTGAACTRTCASWCGSCVGGRFSQSSSTDGRTCTICPVGDKHGRTLQDFGASVRGRRRPLSSSAARAGRIGPARRTRSPPTERSADEQTGLVRVHRALQDVAVSGLGRNGWARSLRVARLSTMGRVPKEGPVRRLPAAIGVSRPDMYSQGRHGAPHRVHRAGNSRRIEQPTGAI